MDNIGDSYNFRNISDHLTTSGSVTREQLASLKSQGYEVLINLLPHDNKHALPEEPELVESQQIEYIRIPVDWNAPTEENYAAFVAAIQNTQQRKTHIHCAANWRVSAFYSIYASGQGIWDQKTARAHIENMWNPNDFPVWKQFLANHGLNF